jgi:hypothetical protein
MISIDASNSGLNFTIGNKGINLQYDSIISNNTFIIANIKVLSSGTFYFRLIPNSINIKGNYSNLFTATNSINRLIAKIPEIKNYQLFPLILDLRGDDLNYFMGSLEIYITELSDLGINGTLEWFYGPKQFFLQHIYNFLDKE